MEHEACCSLLPSHSIIHLPHLYLHPFVSPSPAQSPPPQSVRTPFMPYISISKPSATQNNLRASLLLQRHHTHSSSSQHHGDPDVCILILRPCTACERTTTIPRRGRLRARRRRQQHRPYPYPYPFPGRGTARVITSPAAVGERIRRRGIDEE